MRQEVNPITLEVVKNALIGVADEAMVRFTNSALSPMIKEVHDCSVGICDPQGRLIATTSMLLPVQCVGTSITVREILAEYGVTGIRPGDLYLLNDPFRGGQHHPDLITVKPIFWGEGLWGFFTVVAHHMDVGGKVPGSCPGDSTDMYQDGLRIPIVRLCQGGVYNEDLMKLILSNSRTPYYLWRDLQSQMALCHFGEGRLRQLAQRFGHDTLRRYIEELLNYAERRCRSAIARVKPGRYESTDWLDDDGIDQQLVQLKVAIEVSDGAVTVDFTGTAAQTRGPINCPIAPTTGATFYAVLAMLDPDIPLNDGAFRPLTLIAPKGCLLNPSGPPVTVNLRTQTALRVVDLIFDALGQALPGQGVGMSSGHLVSPRLGFMDPQRGHHRVLTGAGLEQSSGARSCKDGLTHQSTYSCRRNEPLEAVEAEFPQLLFERFEIDSPGGAGKFRGGESVRKEITLRREEAILSLSSERHRFPPRGVLGGMAGSVSRCLVRHANGREEELGSKVAGYALKAGDTLILINAAAGGYGDPRQRDPELVRRDVLEGRLSAQEAATVYGVTISEVKGGESPGAGNSPTISTSIRNSDP